MLSAHLFEPTEGAEGKDEKLMCGGFVFLFVLGC